MSFTNVSCRTIKPSMIPSNYSHTSAFATKTWGGYNSIKADCVWTDNINIYYSDKTTQYVLNKITSTWEPKIWNGLASFYGYHIWTDGINIYYDNDENGAHYILSGDTWEEKIWGENVPHYGQHIWTDGVNIYYDDGHTDYFILNDGVWETRTWSGYYLPKGGAYVWTNGIDIYYSSVATHLIFNREKSSWTTTRWNGLDYFNGDDIWTDGINVYCGKDYILNGDTWDIKTWGGLSSAVSNNVWTDESNIYFSDSRFQYVLLPTTAKLYQRTYNSSGGEWVEVSEVQDSPLPLEISNETEMNALLKTAEVGNIYKYTGATTDTYENGALYVVEINFISFTIDGVAYQAEKGMTWSEWCTSDYNIIGVVDNGSDNGITLNNLYIVVSGTTVFENGLNAIVDGAAYESTSLTTGETS